MRGYWEMCRRQESALSRFYGMERDSQLAAGTDDDATRVLRDRFAEVANARSAYHAVLASLYGRFRDQDQV